MKIILVGYMGCGKSTLSRRIARQLGLRAFDTDAEVEALGGASVADLFRYEGEESFRLREREVVERLAASDEALVVATGGGLPLWQDNMDRLNALGITVYLRRSAECIARRLSPYGRRKRPRLSGLSDDELVDFMRRDIAVREPFYARARVVVDCDALSDDEIVERILTELK